MYKKKYKKNAYSLATLLITISFVVANTTPSVLILAQETNTDTSINTEIESEPLKSAAGETGEEIEIKKAEDTEQNENKNDIETTENTESNESELKNIDEVAIEETTNFATSTSSTTPEISTPTSSTNTETLSTSTPPQEGPDIVSGQAVALANILNLINTNFINSEGVMLFSNFFELITHNLDFRNHAESNMCGEGSCAVGGELLVQINNNAIIENLITLNAITGENIINGGENTSIETGNAYAGLNLINVANTSFIDSEYLLVTMNAFSGINGDIVFPSLYEFFNSLSSGASNLSALNIENNGTIENNLNIETSAGGNTTHSTTSSTITTGDAHSSSNVFNQINTTLEGERSVSILFKVHGNWVGEIFGAPAGLSWTHTPDGSIAIFDTSSNTSTSSTTGDAIKLTSSSTALIKNDVNIIALTGDNRISNVETALISTGNAYAGANIVNIANGNIVGRNWILAIINIFGDFNGNIAFGQPDLWVGEQIETSSRVENGTELNYHFTVINNGDSPATEVLLTDKYASSYLDIIESSADYTIENGEITWKLKNLPPGTATEVSYRALIRDASAGSLIENTVRVSARETDFNIGDNSDTATVEVYTPPPLSSGRRNRGWAEAREETTNIKPALLPISVQRINLAQIVHGYEEKINQTLIVKNDTDTMTAPIVLVDIIRDPKGNIVREEPWDLGSILPNEEITLTYEISFQNNAEPGIYILSTSLTDSHGIETKIENNGVVSLLVNQTPQIELAVKETATEERVELAQPETLTLEESAPEVAGTSTQIITTTSTDSKKSLPERLELVIGTITAAMLAGLAWVGKGIFN